MSDFIGPCLPPHLKKRKEEEVTDSLNQQPMIDVVSTSLSSGPDITSTKVDDTKNREYGPVIGPMLPSCLSEKDSEISGSEDGSVGLTEVSYGPLVPPSSQVSFGPALPPNMCSNEKDNLTSEKIGLNVSSVEEDDEIIGPLPGAFKSEKAIQRHDIDTRAKRMREKLTSKGRESNKPERETWMMELPPETRPSGLGARKFRTKYIDTGDRSVWTKMPGEETTKESGKKTQDAEEFVYLKRDQEFSKEVEEYNRKHRSESLVDIHRKQRAEEHSDVNERRPFNRDTDLDLPQKIITSTKRKNLIKDSEISLDSKFTHGKRSFL